MAGRYEELREGALALPVYKDIKNRGFSMNGDQLSESPLAGPKLDLCYMMTGADPCRLCGIWFGVYFMKYRIVSRNCFRCWKVVLRMDSIRELYTVWAIQRKHHISLGIASKCGKEERPYCQLKGRYNAFWYASMKGNDGLKEAQELTHVIFKDIEMELPHLADKLILKRGCTEMEMQLGPSNLWQYPEEQHEFEDKLDELFVPAQSSEEYQPPWLRELVEFAWLEHGIDTRDPDIGEYVENPARYRNTIQTVDYFRGKRELDSRYVKKGRTNEYYAKKRSQQRAKQPLIQLI